MSLLLPIIQSEQNQCYHDSSTSSNGSSNHSSGRPSVVLISCKASIVWNGLSQSATDFVDETNEFIVTVDPKVGWIVADGRTLFRLDLHKIFCGTGIAAKSFVAHTALASVRLQFTLGQHEPRAPCSGEPHDTFKGLVAVGITRDSQSRVEASRVKSIPTTPRNRLGFFSRSYTGAEIVVPTVPYLLE